MRPRSPWVPQADPEQRLRAITASTQRLKQQERGHSGLLLGWLFGWRQSGSRGQFFVDHQRLVHTFETNLRGPAELVSIAGRMLEQIVPIAVNPGMSRCRSTCCRTPVVW